MTFPEGGPEEWKDTFLPLQRPTHGGKSLLQGSKAKRISILPRNVFPLEKMGYELVPKEARRGIG